MIFNSSADLAKQCLDLNRVIFPEYMHLYDSFLMVIKNLTEYYSNFLVKIL